MPTHTASIARGISRREIVRASAASAAALALGVPAGRAAAQAGGSVSLALDWYPNANHAGIYMARERGYFEEAGIDLDIVVPSDPTTVLHTVGAGRDTFGISYHSEVLFAREQEVPVVSVAAIVQHPLNALMVLTDSGIKSPADLAGKTVAIAGVPADEVLLQTILEHSGLSMDDVEVVNVGWDLMPAVFSERADATLGVYWTHETILAEREGYDVTFFRVEEWGVPDHYELVLVAGESTVEGQEDLVRGFLGALQRGYHDAIVEPDLALDLLVAESPDLVPEVEAEGIALLAPLWTDDGAVPWGTQTAERWDAFGEWLKEGGLLGDEVEIASAWRGDLLPEADEATPVATPAG